MRVRFWWAAALVAAAAGCSGGPGGVTGTVNLDGKPVPRASVTFVPETEGGRDAHGYTDENGRFRLATFSPNDGAMPGKYKVVVGQPTAELLEAPPAKSSEEAMANAAKAKVKRPAVVIPERYTRPDQTPLTQDVPAAGPVVIELTSK